MNPHLTLRQDQTFARIDTERSNCFGAIRLCAASAVTLSHCFALTGHNEFEPLARQVKFIDLATVGVIAFFVISGFLVTLSAQRSAGIIHFAFARLARIWPALVVVSILSALVLGPVVSGLPAVHYFSMRDSWLYPVRVALFDVGHYLPGVFLVNPIPRGVNGSLWTLQVEVFLYSLTGCLVLTKVVRKPVVASCFVLICALGVWCWPSMIMQWVPRHDEYMTPRLMGAYAIGALACLHRGMIPRSGVLVVTTVFVCVIAWGSALFDILFFIAFAYTVLYLGLRSGNFFTRIADRIDLSYGIYIYSFPIQQACVSTFGIDRPLVLAAVAFPIVVSCAALSWFAIENPILTKRRLLVQR